MVFPLFFWFIQWPSALVHAAFSESWCWLQDILLSENRSDKLLASYTSLIVGFLVQGKKTQHYSTLLYNELGFSVCLCELSFVWVPRGRIYVCFCGHVSFLLCLVTVVKGPYCTSSSQGSTASTTCKGDKLKIQSFSFTVKWPGQQSYYTWPIEWGLDHTLYC